MAKFEVKVALRMPTRANLSLGGDILEGTISIGDVAKFRHGTDDVQLEIIKLGAIDHNIGRSDFFSLVALVFADEEEVFDPDKIPEQEITISKGT